MSLKLDFFIQIKHVQSYWMGSRKLQEKSIGTSAMVTLYNAAEAHARLCLRNTVSVEDAVVSIALMEESVLAFTGSSVLGIRFKF